MYNVSHEGEEKTEYYMPRANLPKLKNPPGYKVWESPSLPHPHLLQLSHLLPLLIPPFISLIFYFPTFHLPLHFTLPHILPSPQLLPFPTFYSFPTTHLLPFYPFPTFISPPPFTHSPPFTLPHVMPTF